MVVNEVRDERKKGEWNSLHKTTFYIPLGRGLR
jgi:hypothetical protein